MPLNHQQIVSVLQQVSEQKGLQATVSGVAKGTCTVAAFAAGGGLLGGPVGLGIGGVFGSILAAINGRGQYKSVPEIIMFDMTDEQRVKLARSVEDIFRNLDAQDVIMAVTLLMANDSLQKLLFAKVGSYLKSEMGLSLL